MFYFVLQVISKLMENRKIANATHNMYAYRIKQGELQQFVSANFTDGRIFPQCLLSATLGEVAL